MVIRQRRSEAREWAFEEMRGCANVLIPTFTRDMTRLNEGAIRHDVRRNIELGFWGALVVAETAASLEEYHAFMEWAVDEAKGRLHVIHHAAFNTLEENLIAVKRAESAGASLALLSYPQFFYPRDENDIYEYTKTFCEGTSLPVQLFPAPLWGFERLHPASLSPTLIERLVADVSNIVAVKAEGGYPSLGGFADLHHRVGKQVLVTLPIESVAIPLATIVPLQYIGTSNMEYFGSAVPRMHRLVLDGNIEGAMEIFWQIHPARQASERVLAIAGANAVHRMAWKYMAWLNGFNGGPLRMPTMRIVPAQMRMLREALVEADLDATADDDREFFTGRVDG